MNKGNSIVIYRCANGYYVRPENEKYEHVTNSTDDVYVFSTALQLSKWVNDWFAPPPPAVPQTPMEQNNGRRIED